MAAALTEPPAAGQSSQQRVNLAREAEATDEQAPENPAAPRDHAGRGPGRPRAGGCSAGREHGLGQSQRQGHAPGRAVRRLRLPRPLHQVRGDAPEHRHQGRHRELPRPPLEPRQAPGGRLGRRRHRVGRGRLHRAVQVTAEPVREPEQDGRQEPAASSGWTGSGGSRSRRTAPRSASARTSAASRSATGATCSRRPACRRTAQPSRRSGRPGRSSSPSASASRSTRRRASPSSTPAATSSTRSSAS